MDRRDLSHICADFEDGALDLYDPDDCREVLRVETQRRLFAYVFERRAHALLRAAGLNAASGWHVLYDGDEPRSWLRLYTPDEPMLDTDIFVQDWLRDRGCIVLKSHWTPGLPGLYGEIVGGKAGPLHELLATLPGARDSGTCATTPIHDRTDPPHFHPSAVAAVEALGEHAVRGVVAARLLMNCHLERWFHARAADVDAIVRGPGDRLAVVECKRKHPARNLTIGLDQQGVRLMDWLSWRDAKMWNLVLVNPVWRDGYDAGRLLDPALSDHRRTAWIAAVLHRGRIVGTNRTSGSKSGMHEGDRTQAAFPLSAYRIVGRGLDPDGGMMRDWLADRDMPSATELVRSLAPALA